MNILMTESKRRQETEKARTRTPSSTSDILRDWYGLNALVVLFSLSFIVTEQSWLRAQGLQISSNFCKIQKSSWFDEPKQSYKLILTRSPGAPESSDIWFNFSGTRHSGQSKWYFSFSPSPILVSFINIINKHRVFECFTLFFLARQSCLLL